MRSTVLLLSALIFLAPAGCKKKAQYVDPDAQSKVEGTGLESRDVRAVVAQMSSELLKSDSFPEGQAPRVAVMPVENRSRFLIDQDIFNTLITDELINNAHGRMAVVNRDLIDAIMKEREMKARGQVDDTNREMSPLAGVDFFLEGEVRGLSASTSRKMSDYVVVRFQLTNAETGVVSWSSSYEMKKEGSWGVMYQ